jgi:hypothetical protein
MAYLFIVENSVAKPTEEILLITPFKEIWERDETDGKENAVADFTYIEFMSSKKRSNPYAGYRDEDRHEKLKELLFDEEWEPDELVEQALIKVAEFQTEASPTYSYYLAVLKASEKMKDFFNSLDMEATNKRTGLPIYKPADITRAIVDTDKVLQNLNNMKEKVEQELFEQTKTKGNKKINPFEQ